MTGLRSCFLFMVSTLLLAACSSFWQKDNTPAPAALVQFNATLEPHLVWNKRVSTPLAHHPLKLGPVVGTKHIVVADPQGTITLIDKPTGKILWKISLHTPIATAPAMDEAVIVVATQQGSVIALSMAEKKERWRTSVNNEILATPVISNHIVLIKAVDGTLTALSANNGRLLWTHSHLEPNLILWGASTPQVRQQSVIVGYASGKVIKLSLEDGQEQWAQTITTPEGAFAIERMVDIDADPIIADNQLFVVTYQGKIAALNLSTGQVLWENKLSSYTGMVVDSNTVYVSDAQGSIWAFDRYHGQVLWKQIHLAARQLTAPVAQGAYLVVGDAQGALHWLKKRDGSFAGRVVAGAAICANPVAAGNSVYALTEDGHLLAYTL